MKPPSTIIALALIVVYASAAEHEPKGASEPEQWQRVADWLAVELQVTNITEFTNNPLFRCFIVHPSFGLRWDEVPPPTLTGSVALATVTAFVLTNGWNMQTGKLEDLSFAYEARPIRGLPWAAIREREFPALTHKGVLYVMLTGFHHSIAGVAYNPQTNTFAPAIESFKPLRDHWYVWNHPELSWRPDWGSPRPVQQYEGQNR